MLMFILLCGLRELGLLCFNTSHVNVYRSGLLLIFANQSSFNTSYVNVYHKPSFGCVPSAIVSIHPMLMFIYNNLFIFHRFSPVSIHPMLVFINGQAEDVLYKMLFQYILC